MWHNTRCQDSIALDHAQFVQCHGPSSASPQIMPIRKLLGFGRRWPEVVIWEASVRSPRFLAPTSPGEFCGLQREDAEAGPVRCTAP